MALQQLGEGPRDASEVCTELERGMLVEGLELMSFYSPLAERRLAELAPRLEGVKEEEGVGAGVAVGEAGLAQVVGEGLTPGGSWSLEALLNLGMGEGMELGGLEGVDFGGMLEGEGDVAMGGWMGGV